MKIQKLKLAATFTCGIIFGALLVGGLLLAQRPGQASPKASGTIHYAASGSWNTTATAAVNDLRTKGIIVTPSVAKYDGNAYVTRFEAAVLIDRFVHYVEAGRKPLHPTMLNSSQMPDIEQGPGHNEMVDLVKNRFIVPNSPLLTEPGTGPVTANELSDAMTTTVNRIVDRGVKPNTNGMQED